MRFTFRTLRPDGWQISALLLAGLVIIPISVLLSSLLDPEEEIWQHLTDTVLSTLVLNTSLLSAGVLVCTSILGISLGWLVGACSFPGRSIFSWALTLPMAIPAYVMAFIFIGLMDFTGPIQSTLRLFPGFEQTIIEVRSTPFVVLVLSLSLYPYVYLLCRSAFLSQGRSLMEAARTLNVGPWKAFWLVMLPMARPWVISGLTLVLMETLADFGAVSIFNYDTFTTAIYKAWFGFFSLKAAAQLSSVLVIFALSLVVVEGLYKSRVRFFSNARGSSVHSRLHLAGGKGIAAMLYCATIVLIAFLIPVGQLSVWIAGMVNSGEFTSYMDQAYRTLFLGVTAAILTCIGALLLCYAKRKSPTKKNMLLCKVSTIGYALPGTVLAVGIFLPTAWFDHTLQAFFSWSFNLELGPLLQGTLFVMLMAYAIRFLAAAYGPMDSSMQGITPNLDEAAAIHNIKGLNLIRLIHLPLLKKGLMTALILVMVDVIKEMPITLMTRPFGWDTLAVKIFELTSEGEWERAALPGLYLVLVSIIPVIMLIQQTDK